MEVIVRYKGGEMSLTNEMRQVRSIINWVERNSMVDIKLSDLVWLFDPNATLREFVQFVIDTLNDITDNGYYTINPVTGDFVLWDDDDDDDDD